MQSVFRKLDNLYRKIVPLFEEYGFKSPSAGVVARDLSEKIEDSIRQHCETFDRGPGPVDLQRHGEQWEVKICKDSGLTINQSKRVAGENYIVLNYRSPSHVKSVWVLWRAEDEFFSPRKPNANARAIRRQAAEENIETRSVEALVDIRIRVQALLEDDALDPHDASIAKDDNPIVADFVEIARMATLSDVSRRNRDGRVWIRKNLLAMLDSVEAHARALSTFRISPGRVSAIHGDARDLRSAGIDETTVDAVVTSPPYSIALDYVKNDDHALEALGVSSAALRHEMTGVRGRGPKQKLALYNEDMRRMFHEVARVLKPGARAAFVIGDATVDRSEYTTTQEMGDWAVAAGLEREREIPKIVFGLYNVMQDEKILVFRKPADGHVPGV